MAWQDGDAPPAAPAQKRRFRDLTIRAVAGVVMAAIALVAIYAGPVGVVLITALVLGGIAAEWRILVLRGMGPALAAGGGTYLLIAGFSFLYLYFGPYFDNTDELSRNSLLWFLALIVANDSFAYGVGRIVGGPRLAPRISPKKTWSGTLGGVAAAAIAAGLAAWAMGAADPGLLAAVGLGLGVVAQIGDLAESRVKRQLGVKDASKLIPGHGGLLDRVDGLAAAAIVLAAAQLLSATAPLQWTA